MHSLVAREGNIVIEMQQGVSWQSHLTMQIESSRDVDNNNNNKDNNNNNLQQKSVKCLVVLHSLLLLLLLLFLPLLLLVVSVNICQSADDPHQVGLLLLSPHRYAVRSGNLRLQKL